MSDLAQIYRGNEYPAELDGAAIVLRHGETCPALDALLSRRGLGHAAYVTAFDPGGVPRDRATNERAMAELRARLAASYELAEVPRGWPPGAPDPEGRREPSLLVLGMSPAEADDLGRELGQLAVVVHTHGARSEVRMLTRSGC